jgi:hypothetical protein
MHTDGHRSTATAFGTTDAHRCTPIFGRAPVDAESGPVEVVTVYLTGRFAKYEA